MFGVLGVYAFIRLRAQPQTFSFVSDDDVLVGASFWEKGGYGLELLARYAGLIVAPIGLCTGRTYAEVFRPASVSLVMVAGASLCGLAAYASWRAYRRGGFPFVAAAFVSWFLVTGLVFAMPESMADRFLLLPSLFLSLSLGPMLSSFAPGNRGRQVLLLMGLGVQLVLSNLQARTWHDEGALWSHAVRACPNSMHNQFRYAEYLSRQGNTAEAVWHYAVLSKGRHAFPYAWSTPPWTRSVPCRLTNAFARCMTCWELRSANRCGVSAFKCTWSASANRKRPSWSPNRVRLGEGGLTAQFSVVTRHRSASRLPITGRKAARYPSWVR